MRRLLFATTCLVTFSAGASAETIITTKAVQQVKTSTAKAGSPDDVSIAASGSIVVTGTNALLVDSSNKVSNAGTIQISNVDHAIGIEVSGNQSGGITNSGKIIIDETYAATDADKDGDLDGPLAVGTGRFGIHTTGAFAGNIVNSGSIEVEGNDSTGIKLGGTLTGKFVHDGSTKVTGDRSQAIALGQVDGDVRLAGTVSATGLGATGAHLSGAVNGALVIQGQLVATGYRFPTAPADPSKLDVDDLLQGGSALIIGDNVTKGIILAVPPKDLSPTDNDEDKDGIEDSKEGTASVTSYGAAAAMLVGATGKNILIGSVPATGTGFGLIVDGSILGDGVYTGVSGNGLMIGGQGGTVAIAKGIGVSGSIRANSIDRAATAIRLGAGAATAEIRNAGVIAANSGKGASANATAKSDAAVATKRNEPFTL